MRRHERLRLLHAVALCEHRAERLDLHLAEARQRGEVRAQLAGVGRVGPHPRGIAVVTVADVDGEVVHALGHRAREAVDRGRRAEDRLEVGLGAPALLELADVEGVAGLKQAVGALDADTLEVLAGAGDRLAVLGGDDPFLLPVVLMGGTGAIAASAHLCTARFAAMLAHGARGEVAEGRRHAEGLLWLVQALFAEPSPAVLKAVLHAEGRLPSPHVRMPLADASPGATARALQELATARTG